MKPIRLSGHAKEQLFFRGTTEDEIIDAIKTSSWQPAQLGRLECKKDLSFENIWNNKYYKIKQVRPIYRDPIAFLWVNYDDPRHGEYQEPDSWTSVRLWD